MLKENVLICDCCDEEIPGHTKYRKAELTREQFTLLKKKEDPEFPFTRSEAPDGTIIMNICFDCLLRLGKVPGNDKMN